MCWWPRGRKPVWGGLRVNWGSREAHKKLAVEQGGGQRRSQADGASAEGTARAKALRRDWGTVRRPVWWRVHPAVGGVLEDISGEAASGSRADFEQGRLLT